MTHTSTELPEALRLAAWLITAPQKTTIGDMLLAGRELRRLHARVQELEAELEKAKASVSGLKKRSDDWKWRALNAEASQARVPLSDEAVKELIANTFVSVSPMDGLAIARAIEAEHGITQEKQG